MPRYVIHIGPPKTGSTFLQHGFTRLAPDLARRGIFYPLPWGGPHGHHILADALAAPDPALADGFARINAAGFQTILLSSETFADLTPQAIRTLHGVLDGPAQIVFYARAWSSLLPSAWREQVKHGSAETLPDFLLPHLHRPAQSNIMNFGLTLDRYAAVFGRAAIRLVPYDQVLSSGDDLLSHFRRHFLDWPDPEAAPPEAAPAEAAPVEQINLSLDMVDSEILRALNVLGGGPFAETFARARPSALIAALVAQAMRYHAGSITLEDTTEGLHEDLAAAWRSAVVPPLPETGLFAPRTTMVSWIKPDYLMTPDALTILTKIRAALAAGKENDDGPELHR